MASVYRRAGLQEKGIAEYQQKVKGPSVNPADAIILAEMQLAAQNTAGAREAFEIALKWAKSEPFTSYAREGLASLPK